MPIVALANPRRDRPAVFYFAGDTMAIMISGRALHYATCLMLDSLLDDLEMVLRMRKVGAPIGRKAEAWLFQKADASLDLLKAYRI